MTKEVCEVLAGNTLWHLLKIRDHLDYSKVVLVLTGDNQEVDDYALQYLDYVIERKKAKSAIIYVLNEKQIKKVKSKYPVQFKKISQSVIELIYKRYISDKFYKNIFWTYTDKTPDNLLGRFMRETEINAEDVVCLAIYNFRGIPDEVVKNNVCE